MTGFRRGRLCFEVCTQSITPYTRLAVPVRLTSTMSNSEITLPYKCEDQKTTHRCVTTSTIELESSLPIHTPVYNQILEISQYLKRRLTNTFSQPTESTEYHP
jgi:hypothetical protein